MAKKSSMKMISKKGEVAGLSNGQKSAQTVYEQEMAKYNESVENEKAAETVMQAAYSALALVAQVIVRQT